MYVRHIFTNWHCMRITHHFCSLGMRYAGVQARRTSDSAVSDMERKIFVVFCYTSHWFFHYPPRRSVFDLSLRLRQKVLVRLMDQPDGTPQFHHSCK